jgi:hypothetical protein
VEAQKADTKLKHLFKSNAVLDKGLELQIIENKTCICNKGWLVIPKPLQPSEDAIWDLQEVNFMGVMSKNTPIKLILLITLCIDRDQINFVGKK